jgi:2-phospho-L-lactate/phosphoenolpyruvate guanylyltransferase
VTGWRAIVPIKPPAERKLRLRGRLDADARALLSDAMLRRVLEALARSVKVERTFVLSAQRPAGWSGKWLLDQGRGLNVELQRIADGRPERLLVVHADLPLISTEDVDALLAASTNGVAIAADRHGLGTNAIALQAPARFRFAFGVGSLRRHLEAAGPAAQIVHRPGLALDVDTPDDLAAAIAAGCIGEMLAA